MPSAATAKHLRLGRDDQKLPFITAIWGVTGGRGLGAWIPKYGPNKAPAQPVPGFPVIPSFLFGRPDAVFRNRRPTERRASSLHTGESRNLQHFISYRALVQHSILYEITLYSAVWNQMLAIVLCTGNTPRHRGLPPRRQQRRRPTEPATAERAPKIPVVFGLDACLPYSLDGVACQIAVGIRYCHMPSCSAFVVPDDHFHSLSPAASAHL